MNVNKLVVGYNNVSTKCIWLLIWPHGAKRNPTSISTHPFRMFNCSCATCSILPVHYQLIPGNLFFNYSCIYPKIMADKLLTSLVLGSL